MKTTIKTHYALCAVAAGLLFVGASGPLVQYVCGGPGAPACTTPAVTAVSTSAAGPATASYTSLKGGCQNGQGFREISGRKGSERSSDASTVPSSEVSSKSGPFCCIVEPTRAGSAAVPPGENTSESELVVALAAAQAAFDRPRPDRNAFFSSLAHRSRDVASPAGVSARILTSVFLL
jgi:hypothetical protein